MKDLAIDLFPGEEEGDKALVELYSTGRSSHVEARGDARTALRLLAEAMCQVGPSVRDGMSDDFEYWKMETFRKVFEACFGDVDEVLKKTKAEIERLDKEIKAKKGGIVIDADAIV